MNDETATTPETLEQATASVPCDQERIHLIQTVQGHGLFLAVRDADFFVHALSGNAPTFLGRDELPSAWLGRALGDFLPHVASEIRARLDAGALLDRERFTFAIEEQTGPLEVHVFPMNGRLVGVEIERAPARDGPFEPHAFEESLRRFLAEANSISALEELAGVACRIVRKLTRMDRVMLYRFRPPEMHGEVMAEDKVATARSYLHHRYPASDIPAPARALYLRNKVRVIRDVMENDASLVTRDSNASAFDMTHARLRSVSKAHAAYMKNMDQRSSLSIAIEVEGQLWGLIACHSRDVTPVSHEIRGHCETLAQFLSVWFPRITKLAEQEERLSFDAGLRELFRALRASREPVDSLFRSSLALFRLFDCSGMALSGREETDIVGQTPFRTDVVLIADRLRDLLPLPEENESPRPLAISSLSELGAVPGFESDGASLASGLLAIRTGDSADSVLMLFRAETIRSVKWGGDPRKALDARRYGGSVNPRASFDTWLEEIRHTSLPWKDFHKEGILHLHELLFATLLRTRALLKEAARSLKSQGK